MSNRFGTTPNMNVTDDGSEKVPSSLKGAVEVEEHNENEEIKSRAEEEEERWYAAEDGSYIMERRKPFFSFNLCCYIVCFGIFCYFAYTIVKDYIDQQSSPPTTVKVQSDPHQLFPGLILCNLDPNAPLDVVDAIYQNELTGANTILTDEVKPFGCNSSSSSSTSNTTKKCLSLDQTLPAFQGDGRNTLRRSRLALVLDINPERYSNTTIFLGVAVHLHPPLLGESIEEEFCTNDLFDPQKCFPVAATLASDRFSVSSGTGTLVTLSRQEVQTNLNCKERVVRWEPKTTTMTFNQEALGGVNVSGSIVVMEMTFDVSTVTTVTYNPISAFAMFGSLSGWFGFLTDGWGAVSILFFLERTLLYLRDYRQGKK